MGYVYRIRISPALGPRVEGRKWKHLWIVYDPRAGSEGIVYDPAFSNSSAKLQKNFIPCNTFAKILIIFRKVPPRAHAEAAGGGRARHLWSAAFIDCCGYRWPRELCWLGADLNLIAEPADLHRIFFLVQSWLRSVLVAQILQLRKDRSITEIQHHTNRKSDPSVQLCHFCAERSAHPMSMA